MSPGMCKLSGGLVYVLGHPLMLWIFFKEIEALGLP